MLYYITHINNIPFILKNGILSHEGLEKSNIKYTSIYDEQIISTRRNKRTPDGKSLWSFANLYFQPRNPMLYRVICEKSIEDIAILAVKNEILDYPDIFIVNGNASSMALDILPADEGRKALGEMKRALEKEWWIEESGTKRKIMGECLVPEVVPPEYIQTIYVVSHEIAQKVRRTLTQSDISVVPNPYIFSQSTIKIDLSQHLAVVDGDMFFSKMQTFTVSVNCVGIMGKGLALRFKWQFPDVYVHYQYVCQNRILQMGKPYLYKRESSLDYQLADELTTLKNRNGETWVLLFPTKQHWREKADINGIETGLQWLCDNYKKWSIKSLAMPALGCGLGQLKWCNVGALLCKYLSTLDIPVWLYLPTEEKVSEDLLTKDFLLSQKD